MAKATIKELIQKLDQKKTGEYKDISDGKKYTFDILRYVYQQASEYPDKVFVLQELYLHKEKIKLLRFGYYILGKKPKFKDKWAWGQFCPFIVGKDLGALIKKAKNKGML